MNKAQKRHKIDWKFMLPLVLGTMLNPLNSTMLATALASICNAFARNASSGAMLIIPLYIASMIGMPLMGRLSDIYDPKQVNKLGYFLVLIAAVVGMMAQQFYWLIIARVLLGLGTAAAFPSAMALVAIKYKTAKSVIPGNVLGIMTMSSQVSMVLGPLLGGILTHSFGWRSIFFINIPWILVALYYSSYIPHDRKEKQSGFLSIFNQVDGLGVILFILFIVLLVLIMTGVVFSVFMIIVTFLAFLLFIFWERYFASPFINIPLLWSNPSLLLVYVRTLATTFILYLLLYSFPQWIQIALKMSAAKTGFMMFPLSIMSAISAIAISKGSNVNKINIVGVGTMLMACFSLFLVQQKTEIWLIILITMLLGIAIGVNMMANQASLSVLAPSGQVGSSFGLFRTFGHFGAIVSGSQIRIIFHDGVTDKSFHSLAVYALVSCMALVAMYMFSFQKKKVLE